MGCRDKREGWVSSEVLRMLYIPSHTVITPKLALVTGMWCVAVQLWNDIVLMCVDQRCMVTTMVFGAAVVDGY